MRPRKLLGFILICLFIVGLISLVIIDDHRYFEPRLLVTILNIVCAGIIPWIITFIAYRTFMAYGSASVMFLGGGMLSFGFGNIAAGILIPIAHNHNDIITIHNSAVVFGGLLHFLGTSLKFTSRNTFLSRTHSVGPILFFYSGILVFLTVWSILTYFDFMPLFLIQGIGPSPLRQLVMFIGVVLYFQAASLSLLSYFKSKSDFFYWYFISLALIGIGITALFFLKIVGSPIGWLGRSAQYIGCVIALFAVVTAYREGKSHGLSLEQSIAALFSDSEAGYKSLVEAAPDAIVSFDQSDRIIDWNAAAEKIFGISRDDVLGKSFYELLRPEILGNVMNSADQPLSAGLYEWNLRKKDNEQFDAEITAFSRPAQFGTITTCIIRDITEKKLAASKLKASEQRFYLFMNNSPTLSWIKDASGRFTFVSENFESRFRISREECLGKSDYEIFPTNIAGLFSKSDQEALDRNAGLSFLETTTSGEATHHWLVFKFSFQDSSGDTFLGGIALDISDQKRAETALVESEEELRSIFQTSSQGILLTAPSGEVLKSNSAAQRILGYSEDELSRLKRAVVVDQNDTRLPDALKQRMEEGYFEGEINFVRKDGTVFPVRLSSSVFKNAKGELLSSIIFQNITGEKKAQEALKESEERFRVAKSAAKLGIHDYDVIKGEITWDQRCRELWGVDNDIDITYELFESGVHPEDRNKVKLAVQKAFDPASGGQYQAEYRVISKHDGLERWIFAAGQVFFENNRAARLVGTAEDITERKQAEEEIRNLNRALETTLQQRTIALKTARLQNDLLQAIHSVQTQYISHSGSEEFFKSLLDNILRLSNSPFGFIGEIIQNEDDEKQFLHRAISDISWDEKSRTMYEGFAARTGFGFPNIRGIWGSVILEGETVISNNPSTDSRRIGLPDGHPPINSFLGLPLRSNGNLIAMMGIANRPGGYEEDIVDFLQPFLSTSARLIEAYRNDVKRSDAESRLAEAHADLEMKVTARTSELQLTNRKLMSEIGEREKAEFNLKQTLEDLTRSNEDLKHFAYIASHDLQEPLRNIANTLQLLEIRLSGRAGFGM